MRASDPVAAHAQAQRAPDRGAHETRRQAPLGWRRETTSSRVCDDPQIRRQSSGHASPPTSWMGSGAAGRHKAKTWREGLSALFNICCLATTASRSLCLSLAAPLAHARRQRQGRTGQTRDLLRRDSGARLPETAEQHTRQSRTKAEGELWPPSPRAGCTRRAFRTREGGRHLGGTPAQLVRELQATCARRCFERVDLRARMRANLCWCATVLLWRCACCDLI